ncbi:ABC transporter permease [Micromonospora sp. NPDC049004]|uniref:ABC transporter permease n=1 Tax=Micromonospora sp. NPDC049004 TaxID=3154348 RepID=UPI00340D9E18
MTVTLAPATTDAHTPDPSTPPAPTVRRRRWRPGLLAAGAYLILLVVAAAWPAVLAPGDPLAADPLRVFEAPSAAHWFGTDHLGRDMWTRVVHGAGHSLTIGVAATAIAVTGGVLLGLLAGLTHRLADETLSRAFDAISAFPILLLALLFIAVAGPGTVSLIVAIGVATLPHHARVVRGQTLLVRRAAYVEQAVTFGLSRPRLVARHVLPNVIGPVPVLAVIGLGEAVMIAAGLSFLGMGPQPPSPEWGAMLSEGRNYLQVAWWITVLPGVAVTATVVALTVVGRHWQTRFDGRRR